MFTIYNYYVLLISLSRWWELNSRPLPYQGSALPLSYNGWYSVRANFRLSNWSGRPGSNRPPEAWKATALPNELLPLLIPFGTVVISIYLNTPLNIRKCCVVRCGQGWIRTTELRRGQIYSLLPLATWLLARPEPPARIELATYWLQISCSTSWAKVAYGWSQLLV